MQITRRERLGKMAAVGKAPAFQFYAAEWLADEHVRLMTLEETGAYIDALAICWREGSIPADPVMLARLIGKGCTVATATCVQLRFNLGSTEECLAVGRLQHKRLNLERDKQQKRSAQMSEAGLKSAAKKAQAVGTAATKRKRNLGSTQVQPKYNSSSSSLDEDGGAAFESLVAGFPEVLRTKDFLHAWTNWGCHRREIKKPLTDTQSAQQLKQFEAWGPQRAVAAINHTITKGWQGLAEPDVPLSQKSNVDLFSGLRTAGEQRSRGNGN